MFIFSLTESTNSTWLFTPGERRALAKSKVHQWSQARDYGSWMHLLTDLKNMVVCQEWDNLTEDIKARFQFSKAYIWKIMFHTKNFEAIFVWRNENWFTVENREIDGCLTNIKHFLCWYTVISTQWELGKQEIVLKHDARRAECFHSISSFPNFHECWHNCISIRKNVLNLFYNMAQRKKFSVLTLSYINTVL